MQYQNHPANGWRQISFKPFLRALVEGEEISVKKHTTDAHVDMKLTLQASVRIQSASVMGLLIDKSLSSTW